MNQILELREKRAKAWDAAKAFLDSKRGADGMMSAEDAATYDRMEADVVNLGKEIERLERQSAIDRELSQPVGKPLTARPKPGADQSKTGTATDEYKAAFWRTMRAKSVPHEVVNALQVGVESEGGYLAPDESSARSLKRSKNRTSSANWPTSSPRPPATARSPSWPPRARLRGSTRKPPIPRATILSGRCPSVRTSWRR